MSEQEKHDDDLPGGELLPPRELMSLIDGAGLTGTSPAGGLLGAGGVPTTDPAQAGGVPDTSQQVSPTHGLTDDALKQAQSAQGTSDPNVSQTATS